MKPKCLWIYISWGFIKVTVPNHSILCLPWFDCNPRLAVVPQSCRRTAARSWSRRRSSAARARLWSARVTAVTPPCTCAGIATPACPWWTSASLWRYRTVFDRRLSTHHTTVSPVAVESKSCFCPVCPARLPTKDHWFNVLCLLSCLCFCPHFFHAASFHSPSSICPSVHVCPSTLTLLEACSPASELSRPLSRLQGPVSLSVVCWYRAHSLSFSGTYWSREVLQQQKLNDPCTETLQKVQRDLSWSIWLKDKLKEQSFIGLLDI